MADERLVLVPIPSLVSILLRLEKEKGSPLTEEEVIMARDSAVCIATPVGMIGALVERRGYEDIDPEQAWREWQEVRQSLLNE
jgi:hypothetical protein